MKLAMGTLGVLAVVGGVFQIPGVDAGISRFLSPTFADSHLVRSEPSTAADWIGLVIGASIAVIAIALAFRIWVAQPGTATRIRERLPALHTFLYNKWYFDEAIDFLIVRPSLTLGRLAGSVLERTLVEGVVTGGALGAVRVGSAAVRRWQTGFLRYYAAAMLICLSGVALYFLISS
jgi:NADH-quinone oxidoreductase subunit L